MSRELRGLAGFFFQSDRGFAIPCQVAREWQAQHILVMDNGENSLPLSAAQLGLWFAQKIEPDNPTYNIGGAIEIHGPVDPRLFAAAYEQAMIETEALRVRFIEDSNGPRQVIDFGSEISLPLIDVSAESDPEAAAEECMKADLAKPVDLLRGPLFWFALLKVAPDRFFWYQRYHHIVMDGIGGVLFVRRVADHYAALTNKLPCVDNPFGSLNLAIEEDTSYRASDRFARDRQYWLERLADLPEPVSLSGRIPTSCSHLLREAGYLPSSDAETLRSVSHRATASLAQVVIAASGVYLHRLTGARDLVLGIPVSGRLGAVSRRTPCMLSTVLPLRLRVHASMNLSELMEQVAQEIRGGLPRQRYRTEDLRRDLRLLAHDQKLFGTLVNVMLFDQDLRFAGYRTTTHNFSNGPIDDLSILVYDRPGNNGVRIEFNANSALYSKDELATHLRRFLRLLETIAANPRRPIGRLDLLAPDERNQILADWTNTACDVPQTTIPALFEAQVSRSPEAAAVVFEETTLPYEQLNLQANRLASLLIGRGVGPESVVAVALPRSIEMVVGLLGILKAGAAYLPLDPDYPAARLAHLLEKAEAVCVLTRTHIAPRLPDTVTHLLLDHPDTVSALTRCSDRNPSDTERTQPLDPQNPAYVIYTSGSAGAPKGVVVTHGAIVNRLLWMQSAYKLKSDDRILQKTPAGFDVSVWEFFWPLTHGATLVIAKPEGHKDPGYLTRLISTEEVTTVHFVPSMLQAFLQEPTVVDCGQLRRVICSGETLTVQLQQQFFSILDTPLHNLYGPTEAAVDVSFWECVPGTMFNPVPIGRPIWNTQLYVLDGSLQLVPLGVAGELYIAGAGLARGYLRQPGLSAERFVADPYGPPGTRMYRTGDLARWRADGTLDFLGRLDQQLKIRGFRVEAGEIEAVLLQHPTVAHATVIAREDRPGDKRLVGYVVASSGGQRADPAVLRTHLSQLLPDYMVPASVILLEALPLTSNGKLDRKALPAPEFTTTAVWRAPGTPQEEILCSLFAETLGVPRVGIDDNFFELGGHSLLATRLTSRIRATLGIELGIRNVFEAPTVAGLAQRLSNAQAARTPLQAMVRPAEIPLSFAQRRLWFLHRLEGPSSTYNIPVAVRLSGRLDPAALETALGDLVERHESLRTVFAETLGIPRQLILDPANARPTLRVLPVSEATLCEALSGAAQQSFDLSTEIPLRAWLFVLGQSQHVLLLVIHHIAGDGWSLAPLGRDLARAYAARVKGAAPQLPALPVQYADYTLWQQQLLGSETDPDSPIGRQIAFWTETLAGLPEQLELPTDRPRPAVATNRGDTVALRLEPQLHGRLLTLARDNQASLFMVLQAALAALLTRLGSGTDIAIGSPIAGRTDHVLEELVGFFVNTLVLRTDTSANPNFRELLARVRTADLAAYAHQELAFERLVEILNPARSLSRHPLFQVVLAFQNTPEASLQLPGIVATLEPVATHTAKFDLLFSLGERCTQDARPDGIEGVIEYRTDLFERNSIEAIARRLVRLLEAVAANPGQPIGSLELLEPEERRQLLAEWNDTACDVPQGTLGAMFEAQVERSPEATALVFEETTLSYAELNLQANRLAHLLISRGIGPENLVALALPRSAEMVVSLLGILKAGAAYLPLDPDYPAERLAYMLRDAQPACVLTTAQIAGRLPETIAQLLLDHPETAGALTQCPATNPSDAERIEPLNPQNPAYVIYTSGSTGAPKGVVVTHQNVGRLFGSTAHWFHFGPDDVWTLFHSFAFDFSVWELWGALLYGGRLVVVPHLLSRSPAEFLELLAEQRVTVLNQTPSAFYQFIQADRENPASVKVWLCVM